MKALQGGHAAVHGLADGLPASLGVVHIARDHFGHGVVEDHLGRAVGQGEAVDDAEDKEAHEGAAGRLPRRG